MNRPRKKDRHLPACVFLRHGAYWYVKRGKWTRLAPASDLGGALAEYARIQSHGNGGMEALIEESLPALTRGKAPATVKLYELTARQLQRGFKEFSPQQVQPRHVAQMLEDMSATPQMANRCASLLRMVFARAVRLQIVESNPCIGIERHPQPKRTRRITLDEYRAIRAKASPRLQMVMDLCVLTGQRIGDVLKMRREDCTEDGVRFLQQKTKTALVVGWNDELRAAVEAAKAAHGRVASMYVIKGKGALPLAYQPVWRDWQDACEAAGVGGATLHDLRAMSGTEADRQGQDAQALLGHASAQMTKRYLRDRSVPVVHGPSIGQCPTETPPKRMDRG